VATLTQIADAVVAELEGADLSQPVSPERHWRPLFELEEMAALHVTVVPKGVTVVAGSRGRNTFEYEVDVAVQKKLDAAGAAEIDPLVDLVEEIGDLFRLRRLTGYSDAVWVRTEHVPLYATEHLDELRQLTSVLTLTFRVVR